MSAVERSDSAVLIDEKKELVERIRDTVANDRQFSDLYLPMLHRCASFTQRLPLQDNLFRDADGALEFSLILARVTANETRNRIYFPREGQESRRRFEQQCWYLSFLSALATGVAILYQNIEVFDESGMYYSPLHGFSLYDWLEHHRGCWFQWAEESPDKRLLQPEAAVIGASLIPNGRLQYFDRKIVRMMFNAILPRPSSGTDLPIMSAVIHDATDAVMNHFIRKESVVYHESKSAPEQPMDDDIHVQEAKKLETADQPAKPLSTQTQELLKIISLQKAKRDAIREKIEVEVDGLRAPISIFGSFGLRDSTILGFLEKDGLILRREGASCLLSNRLKPYLMPEEA